jgi:hypothetical protein
MSPVVVMPNELNLPKTISNKLKGKRFELLETKRGILLKPAKDFIREARGVLKGSVFSSEKYVQLKREDKELER